MTVRYLNSKELEAGLPIVLDSPIDRGPLKLIVQRPSVNERRSVTTGVLSVESGLLGDNWISRGSSMTDDGGPHPDMQLNIMNARVAELVAQGTHRWELAGDQLFVDLDLSKNSLPSGTRIEIGNAVIEVTAVPHAGCEKFSDRFGADATKFVNSRSLRDLNLRGINAKVVKSGTIEVGDLMIVKR